MSGGAGSGACKGAVGDIGRECDSHMGRVVVWMLVVNGRKGLGDEEKKWMGDGWMVGCSSISVWVLLYIAAAAVHGGLCASSSPASRWEGDATLDAMQGNGRDARDARSSPC